jgi:glucose-1-phosphate cytidylyltransferase
MKVVILCGGYGSRLHEETTVRPKPMVEIGGQPILWHIMRIYSSFGFNEFVIALGYKGELIKNYFLNYYYLRDSFTLHLHDGRVDLHGRDRENWTIHLIDTGLNTQTGGRMRRLAPWIGNETFLMTYGDGVANVNIEALVAHHRSHGKLATVTAVRPPSRFGGLSFNGNLVDTFLEKPQIGEGWINGGFFVLEPAVLDYIDGEDTLFERAPLERLAQEGQLVAYKHEDFWQSMDTMRDVRLLESAWEEGKAPWKVW